MDLVQGYAVRQTSREWERIAHNSGAETEGVFEMEEDCTHLLGVCWCSVAIWPDPGAGQQRLLCSPQAALPGVPTQEYLLQEKYISSLWRVQTLCHAMKEASNPGE